MRFLTVLSGAIACANAIAINRDTCAPTDIDILKITSAMSQLPVAVFQGGLANYSLESFEEQGFDETVYRNIERAADDARQLSQYLSDAIVARGETPAPPEAYEFPSTSPGAFVAFVSGLLGVGTSLFIEVASSVRDSDLRAWATSAAAGLARQTAYFRSIQGLPPSTSALETPLPISAAFTGTRNFVTSATAPEIEALPFETLPFLYTDCTALAEGRFIYISKAIEDAEKSGTEIFAVVLEGLDQYILPVTVNNGTASFDELPEGVMGAIYVALTDQDQGRDQGRFISEAATVEVGDDGSLATGQCINRGPDSGPA